MTSTSSAQQVVNRFASSHAELATAMKNATTAHDKIANALTEAGSELIDAAEAELASAKQVLQRAEEVDKATRAYIKEGLAKAHQLYDKTVREITAAHQVADQKVTEARRAADKHIEARTAEIAAEYQDKLAGVLQREKDIHATHERLRRDNEGVKAQAQAAVAKLEKQIADAASKAADLQRQRDSSNTALQQARDQVTQLADEAKRLRSETTSALARAATATAELEVVKETSAVEIKKHKLTAATAAAAAEKARADLNQVTKELGAAAAEAQQQRRAAAERHGDLTVATEANAKLTAELRSVKEAKAKADGIAQARGEELDTQRTKHAEALAARDAKLRRLEVELAALKGDS